MLEIGRAPEPEAISWDNQHATKKQKCLKESWSYLGATLILLLSCGLIYLIEYFDREAQGRMGIHCGQISTITKLEAYVDANKKSNK